MIAFTIEFLLLVKPQVETDILKKPTSATVTVSGPDQGGKYSLESLSVQLQEEGSQTQPKSKNLDDLKGGHATFSNLSPSTEYIATATATYPNNTRVDSDPKYFSTSSYPWYKTKRNILCFIMFLLSIAIVGTFLIFLIRFQIIDVPAVSKRGIAGDTIVVSDFNSFGLASFNVTECPGHGDYPHPLRTSLVLKGNIVKHVMNDTYTTNRTTMFNPPRMNVLQDEYLIDGSLIEVDICLSSRKQQTATVMAYIFNNLDNNDEFLSNQTDGNSSLYSWTLPVGSASQAICTPVNYSVPDPAYYYLVLSEYTQGNLTYSYDVQLNVVYLNISDYGESEYRCNSSPEILSCSAKFNESNSLKGKEYILVTYINPLYETLPPDTHVCASFKKSKLFTIIIPTILGLLSLLPVLIIIIIIIHFCCYKRYPVLRRMDYQLLTTVINRSDLS